MRIRMVDVDGDIAAGPARSTGSFVVLDWPVGNGNVLALQSLTGRWMVPDEIIPSVPDGILAATPQGTSRSQSKGAYRARGYPFPQRPVTLADERVVPLDDVLGPGFALVAYACNPADALDPDLLARFTELGGRLVQVAPSHPDSGIDLAGCVRDHTDALQKWFTDHAMHVALVRPDRYLFGGGTAAQVPALMQQLLAMLLVDSPTAAWRGFRRGSCCVAAAGTMRV
jgi:hypothetical protein